MLSKIGLRNAAIPAARMSVRPLPYVDFFFLVAFFAGSNLSVMQFTEKYVEEVGYLERFREKNI